WLFAEIARQPWIVFGLQRTEEALSPNVTVGMLLFSLIAFTLMYGALMVADGYLLLKFARRGPIEEETVRPPDPAPASFIGG
ncbi:MAG: cytochrome ubiquinol oxidase subunit I, partial [Anaerolineae bacterium]